MNKRSRIAIVVSHPIQHFCPQYVSYAQLDFCEIKVFFGSPMGFKKYLDKSFGKEIAWSNLGLENFDHVFLNEDVLPADRNLDSVILESELDAYAPDILITYGYFQKLQQRAQAWAAKNKVPVAFISDSELKRERPLVTELLKRFYVRNKFRKISYFLSVGDANESYYRQYGVKDRQLIRTSFPIDIKVFEEAYQDKEMHKASVRAKYKIEEDTIVLSVVGKIEAFKRQQDIIMALKNNELLGKKIALMIIGTGPNTNSLEALAEDIQNCQIIFTGFVSPAELPAYYAATDIYVHPSEKDAHSLSISEAIYMGCPVLVSDRCGSYGPSDDVQEGKNGFVFECGNIDELRRQLNYLVKEPGLVENFSGWSRFIGKNNQVLAHFAGIKSLVDIVASK